MGPPDLSAAPQAVRNRNPIHCSDQIAGVQAFFLELHRNRPFTQSAWAESWEYSQRPSRDMVGERLVRHLSSLLRPGDHFTDDAFPPDETSLYAAAKSSRHAVGRAARLDQREFLVGVTDVTWRRAKGEHDRL